MGSHNEPTLTESSLAGALEAVTESALLCQQKKFRKFLCLVTEDGGLE